MHVRRLTLNVSSTSGALFAQTVEQRISTQRETETAQLRATVFRPTILPPYPQLALTTSVSISHYLYPRLGAAGETFSEIVASTTRRRKDSDGVSSLAFLLTKKSVLIRMPMSVSIHVDPSIFIHLSIVFIP